MEGLPGPWDYPEHGRVCSGWGLPAWQQPSYGELQKAYQRKALENHPDKNLGDPQATAQFQQVTAEMDLLQRWQQKQGPGPAYLQGPVELHEAQVVAAAACRELGHLQRSHVEAVGVVADRIHGGFEAPAGQMVVHTVAADGRQLATRHLLDTGILSSCLPEGRNLVMQRSCWPLVLAMLKLQQEAEQQAGGGCIWVGDAGAGLAAMSLRHAQLLSQGAAAPPQLLAPAKIAGADGQPAQEAAAPLLAVQWPHALLPPQLAEAGNQQQQQARHLQQPEGQAVGIPRRTPEGLAPHAVQAADRQACRQQREVRQAAMPLCRFLHTCCEVLSDNTQRRAYTRQRALSSCGSCSAAWTSCALGLG